MLSNHFINDARISEGITPEHLAQVYAEPTIQKVGHDHRPASPVHHPLATYLSAWIGEQFAGAFLSIRQSAVEFELHVLLLPAAVRQARDLGRACLAWAFAQPIQRVTAYVIDGLDSARNYCIRLGFKVEGCRRQACMKNGVARDVHILGMTRQDWSAT